MTTADLADAVELRFVDLVIALCDNRIDAFVFVGGHPNRDASPTRRRRARRASRRSRGPRSTRSSAWQPYYAKSEIPGGMYNGTDTAQPSFGVAATLVVSADMPEAKAYAVTKAVFEHFDDLRRLFPPVASITKADAARGGVVAPASGRAQVLQGSRTRLTPTGRGRHGRRSRCIRKCKRLH